MLALKKNIILCLMHSHANTAMVTASLAEMDAYQRAAFGSAACLFTEGKDRKMLCTLLIFVYKTPCTWTRCPTFMALINITTRFIPPPPSTAKGGKIDRTFRRSPRYNVTAVSDYTVSTSAKFNNNKKSE